MRTSIQKAKAGFREVCSFCLFFLKDVRRLKWYMWAAIIPGFLRIMDLPNGQDIVPAFAKDGYTYQALWYYTWSRVLEMMLYYTVAAETKSLVYVLLMLLCSGLLINEGISPFGFYITDVFHWIAATLILYVIWYQRNELK